jgi:hypothetical protein
MGCSKQFACGKKEGPSLTLRVGIRYNVRKKAPRSRFGLVFRAKPMQWPAVDACWSSRWRSLGSVEKSGLSSDCGLRIRFSLV